MKCERCFGTGHLFGDECRECDGSGYVCDKCGDPLPSGHVRLCERDAEPIIVPEMTMTLEHSNREMKE